jgi:hypothetical protein
MAELESNLATPLAGWVNGAWNKLPMLFGYSDIVYQNWGTNNLPAGDSNYDSSAVPSGKIWIITNLAMGYTGTTPTNITMRINRSGVYPLIFRQTSPVSNVWYDRQGWWVLKSGDKLNVDVSGATSSNALWAQAIGFAVDIAL